MDASISSSIRDKKIVPKNLSSFETSEHTLHPRYHSNCRRSDRSSKSINFYALTRQNRESSTCFRFLPSSSEATAYMPVSPARTTRRLSHVFAYRHSSSWPLQKNRGKLKIIATPKYEKYQNSLLCPFSIATEIGGMRVYSIYHTR